MSNVINISQTFLVYKLFVFRTHGRWLREWGRSYVVYGLLAIFASVLSWIFIDELGVGIILSQVLITILIVISSYIANKRFTFK